MVIKCIVFAQCFLLLGVTIIFLVNVGNRTSCISVKIHHNFNDIERKRTFYGKWMTGQRHLNQTYNLENTTNMKCCKKEQKLHFVFNNAELNQIDPVAEIRQILHENSILFIGDSAMREFTFGIGELLHLPLPLNSTRLKFLQAYQIFTNRSPPSLNSSVSVPEDRIREAVKNYDVIVVFNQGLQYMIGPTGMTSHHFRCMGELFQEATADENKKVSVNRVLVRKTFHKFLAHQIYRSVIGLVQWRIQDFPQVGAWTLRGGGGAWTHILASFFQRLHEMERIWTPGRGGGVRPSRPLDLPLMST